MVIQAQLPQMDPQFNREDRSKVLYIKGLFHPTINVKVVYNLFSIFGNIVKILLIRGKSNALVQYQDQV